MPQQELLTIVLYDISHDRTRTKVSERCLDFGLERFQYSAFHGRMTGNRREELAIVLEDLISVYGGRITILPIADNEAARRIDIEISAPPIEQFELTLYRGDDDNPIA